MDGWFANGRVIDLILVAMALEVAALALLRRRGVPVPAPRAVAFNLLAGALLLLAVRGALTGAGWGWVALCLGLALPAHLLDLLRAPRAGTVPGEEAR